MPCWCGWTLSHTAVPILRVACVSLLMSCYLLLLCLTPVLRVLCVYLHMLFMSCYPALLRHCVRPLFDGCFEYLFLCLVIICYLLLLRHLWLTPVLRLFCVSLLIYCFFFWSSIVFDHCFAGVLCYLFSCLVITRYLFAAPGPLFYGCFVYLFLFLVSSCCSGIVSDPCFTGVLRISVYVLLSFVAPPLCLTPVLRLFCVSLLMSCYHLLSLVAPALCLASIWRLFCVSLLMACYHFLFLVLYLTFFFTGYIISYILLFLVSPG